MGRRRVPVVGEVMPSKPKKDKHKRTADQAQYKPADRQVEPKPTN